MNRSIDLRQANVILDRIFTTPELLAEPPILIDVGAAGRIHPKWANFARYSICIAFDADERGLTTTRQEASEYKEFHLFDKILTFSNAELVSFYLTKSPSCSSSLLPNRTGLQDWDFKPLFEVVGEETLPATSLRTVCEELHLTRIDWVKFDTQGTDLRLFQSLPAALQETVLVAEFEPGILDAYCGEDKLHATLAYLETLPFWMSHLEVKGAKRYDTDAMRTRCDPRTFRSLRRSVPVSPGWCEVTYMNTFGDADRFSKRDVLLGCAFALEEGQLGVALELCSLGCDRFVDPLFPEIASHIGRVSRSRARVALFRRVTSRMHGSIRSAAKHGLQRLQQAGRNP